MSQGAHLYLADSYIVGNEEDGTTAKAAIAITGATESSKFEIASKGYNIVGGYANQVENATNVPSWDTTDSQASTNLYSTVFGTNTLTDGVIAPIVKTAGFEGSALKTAVADAGWDATTARVDVTVDQKGTTRGENATAGAYAMNLTTGINAMTTVDKADNSYYTISGMKVAKPAAKGLYIHNGKVVIVK